MTKQKTGTNLIKIIGILVITSFLIVGFLPLAKPMSAQDTGTFSGEVNDVNTAKPIPGATVLYRLVGSEQWLKITTNTEGKFSVSLSPGEWEAYTTAVGYLTSSTVGFNIVAGIETFKLFTLTPEAPPAPTCSLSLSPMSGPVDTLVTAEVKWDTGFTSGTLSGNCIDEQIFASIEPMTTVRREAKIKRDALPGKYAIKVVLSTTAGEKCEASATFEVTGVPGVEICNDGIDNNGNGYCDMPTSVCTDGSIPGDPYCIMHCMVDACSDVWGIPYYNGCPDVFPGITTVKILGTPGEEGWYISDVELSLSARDEASKIKAINYSLDEGLTWSPYSVPVIISKEGLNPFQYYSVDEYDNEEKVKVELFKIDKTPPTLEASLTGTLGYNKWWVSNVITTLTATDAISGLRKIRYTLDAGANWYDYLNPFVLKEETIHDFTYEALDIAGNRAKADGKVKIDMTVPETKVREIIGSREERPFDDWYMDKARVYLNAIDPSPSGPVPPPPPPPACDPNNHCAYNPDPVPECGNNPCTTPAGASCVTEGMTAEQCSGYKGDYTTEGLCYFDSGDCTKCQEIAAAHNWIFRKCAESYTCTCPVIPVPRTSNLFFALVNKLKNLIFGKAQAQVVEPVPEPMPVPGPIPEPIPAPADVSGVYKTYYGIDGKPDKVYDDAVGIVVDTYGEHTVYFFSEDNAGNRETIKSVTLKIDKDPDTDGIYSNFDECDNEYGDYYNGCCAKIIIDADKHIITQGGNKPGSVKEPLPKLTVYLYDRSKIQADGISPNWQNWGTIIANYKPINKCVTDEAGTCSMGTASGERLSIGIYQGEVAGKHLGSPATIECNTDTRKYFQLIQTLDGKETPVKTTKVKGSELLIFEPEYIEWVNSQEYYPFIFETLDNWEIVTTVVPPEGYQPDVPEIAETVINETKAVQFTIFEVGSEIGPAEVTFTVKRRGAPEEEEQVITTKIAAATPEEAEDAAPTTAPAPVTVPEEGVPAVEEIEPIAPEISEEEEVTEKPRISVLGIVWIVVVILVLIFIAVQLKKKS